MKPENYVFIARLLSVNPGITQRRLAQKSQMSLYLINDLINECTEKGYIKRENGGRLILTEKGEERLEEYRVTNAVILAAGFGSRCIPLTYETPKGLLEVCGRPMIERQIEQLQEKGINDIYIVVGYKKEQFDYLIDKFGVKLIYNPEYATKNSLASVYRVVKYLDNTYILDCDYWVEENIFNTYEARSWITCIYTDGPADGEWCVNLTGSDRIISYTVGGEDAYIVMGQTYLTRQLSHRIKEFLQEYYNRPGTEDMYWQECFVDRIDELSVYINRQTGNVHEFDSLSDIRLFDPTYNRYSNNETMKHIARTFDVPEDGITELEPMKLGLSNNSFLFRVNDKRYIMRVPGAGTERIINRREEYNVYQAIKPYNISDNVIYFDPDSGYKITEYWENARTCDPDNPADVKACMQKLREFHELKLTVAHKYDVYELTEYYESLWKTESCFRDYKQTKENIMRLKLFIDDVPKDYILSHIDANATNFLFVNINGAEEIRLIDWEYAGMSDPHIDIVSFASLAGYNRDQVDMLIDFYFDYKCDLITRKKIYAYVAVYGLNASNWAEDKRAQGVELGEYITRNYRNAKDFYRIFTETKGDL